MSTAFQSDAFQTSQLAFQIDVGPAPAALAAIRCWVEPARGLVWVEPARPAEWD